MSRPRLGKSAKQDRCEAGDKRNTAWRALSAEAKILSLKNRRGESRRQMRKLTHG